jgi:putative transposase
MEALNTGRKDEERIKVRQSKYLNNLIEQDHRNIVSMKPMPFAYSVEGERSFPAFFKGIVACCKKNYVMPPLFQG